MSSVNASSNKEGVRRTFAFDVMESGRKALPMNQSSIFLYLQTEAPNANTISVRPIPVAYGGLLFDALRTAGVLLDRPCGGTGQCGKCCVRIIPLSQTVLATEWANVVTVGDVAPVDTVVHAAVPTAATANIAGELTEYPELTSPTTNEKALASRGLLAADERLACETRVLASIGIAVDGPLFGSTDHQILTQTSGCSPAECTESFTSLSVDKQSPRDLDDLPIQWYPLELPPPRREDDRADQQRLMDQFRRRYSKPMCSIHPTLLRKLPHLLRACEWHGCVLVDGQRSEAIDFLPDCALHMPTIMVLDLGTTTLAASLLALPTGRELAVTSRLNPQTAFGADVISRIQYASQSFAEEPLGTESNLPTLPTTFLPRGAEQLQRVILETVREMLLELCRTAGTLPSDVTELIVAGNTTMQQLFMGVVSQGLGEVPFAPATCEVVTRNAEELALPLHPAATVQTLPVISGFVGGDIVAGMLATGFTSLSSSDPRPKTRKTTCEETIDEGATSPDCESPTWEPSRTMAELFIDIGTNGEMVLRVPSRTESPGFALIAAATAAGPAFEGAKIRYGMRATTGAIHHVQIIHGILFTDVLGDACSGVDFNTMGGDTACESDRDSRYTHDHTICGLCGSALLDIVAELLDAGILSRDGRILSGAKLPADLSADLRRRIVPDGRGMAFVLADASETTLGEPILLTQRDVRELQLAAGAIRAGIRILLIRANLQESQLARVYLAGGFGNFLRCRSAQRIGLLPSTLPEERIVSVGNSSLAGAAMCGISLTKRQEAVTIAQSTHHLDLSTDPQFSRIFAESMRFPEISRRGD